VDQDGDVIDILVQRRRHKQAAERFFRRLLKGQGREPRWLVTDKLRSYGAAHRTTMPTVPQPGLCEQSSRSLARTDSPTGTSHARVQLPDSGSKISDTARTHTESLSARPPPDAGGQLSNITSAGVSGLEGSGMRIRGDAIAR